MAINYWDDIDDEEITGEYVKKSGGDFPLIPHGARVSGFLDEVSSDRKAAYTDGKQNDFEEDYTKLRIEITKPEDFERQKLFKTFWSETGGEDKLKADRLLFLNIDKIAGGNIAKLRRKATDEELQRFLVGKEMVFVVGLMTPKGNGKPMNYIMGVSASGNVSEQSKQAGNAAKSQTRRMAPIDDDQDIPF